MGSLLQNDHMSIADNLMAYFLNDGGIRFSNACGSCDRITAVGGGISGMRR